LVLSISKFDNSKIQGQTASRNQPPFLGYREIKDWQHLKMEKKRKSLR
jgi:hypothetical protein